MRCVDDCLSMECCIKNSTKTRGELPISTRPLAHQISILHHTQHSNFQTLQSNLPKTFRLPAPTQTTANMQFSIIALSMATIAVASPTWGTTTSSSWGQPSPTTTPTATPTGITCASGSTPACCQAGSGIAGVLGSLCVARKFLPTLCLPTSNLHSLSKKTLTFHSRRPRLMRHQRRLLLPHHPERPHQHRPQLHPDLSGHHACQESPRISLRQTSDVSGSRKTVRAVDWGKMERGLEVCIQQE